MTAARARLAEGAVWSTALACTVPGVLSLAGATPSQGVCSMALAFIPYGAAVALADELEPERAGHLALLSPLLAGLVLVWAPPSLSDDLYRYLWDGRVLRAGLDPYAHAPDDPALLALREAWWPKINHPGLRTIYPPLAQLMFALGAWFHTAPATLKALMLLGHLGTVWVVRQLAGPRHARAGLAYALNPLALCESVLNGHVDGLAGLGLALFAWSLSTSQGPRPMRAALGLALAAGTKLVGLLLLPLGARGGARGFWVALGLCLAVLGPMVVSRPTPDSGAVHYAQRWRGNDSLFRLIEIGVRAGLRPLSNPDGRTLPAGVLRVRAHVVGTVLDPWATAARDRPPGVYPLAQFVARGIALGLAIALSVALARSRLPAPQAARLSVLGALLLAPQVHPWYLLWLLPLEAGCLGLGGLVWSASVLLAYAPLDAFRHTGVWRESSAEKLGEYGLLALGIGIEIARKYRT